MLIQKETIDWSGLNFGNVSPVNNYLVAANITNTLYQRELARLYVSLLNTGALAKVKALNLFFTGTAVSDGLNFVDPVNSVTHGRITWQNDNVANHTLQGYQPNSTGLIFGKSLATLSYCGFTDFSTYGMHVYNSTSDSAGTRTLAGVNSNSATSKVQINIRRANASGVSSGCIDNFTGSGSVTGGSDITKKGLLSVIRAGDIITLCDKGVQLNSITKVVTTPLTLDGNESPYIGTLDGSTVSTFTTARLNAFAITNSFTVADTLVLSNALDTFFTAIGAI